MAMMNRNLVYFIRKHMPDIQVLHNYLSKQKIKEFQKQLLPENVVQEGEKYPERIQDIINEYESLRPAQIKQLDQFFDEYLERAHIKYSSNEYKEYRTAMLFYCMAYGFMPDEFVYYRLVERSLDEVKKYITDLDRKMMQYIFSDFKELQYVFDKTATYLKFKKYYKREAISVATKFDYKKFENFVAKHDVLVIKRVSDSCGHGISIEPVEYEHLRQQFNKILALGKCSIEEKIVQSKVLSIFNTSSVNTLRVISFNTKSGIQIGPCFFRTGRAGAFVDNGGSGGIFAGVDRKTGVIDTNGFDEYLMEYETHPDSGVKYLGFQLPEWEKCIGLVKEMACLVPKIGYIGWDLAFTDNGWVIVEANGGSQFLTQIAYNKGCKDEIMQYINDRNIY